MGFPSRLIPPNHYLIYSLMVRAYEPARKDNEFEPRRKDHELDPRLGNFFLSIIGVGGHWNPE